MNNEKKSLGNRAINATGWKFGATIARFILQIGILAVLSRLLPPKDFGTLGIAMILVGIARLFADLGIGNAIVQFPNLNKKHISVSFTLSLVGGIFFSFIIYFSSSLIAGFFSNEDLIGVMQLMSISFLGASLGIVSKALLTRELNFKILSTVEVASYVIGYGFIGITLAFLDFGVYALVWAVIAQNFTISLFTYYNVLHSLNIFVYKKELKEVLHYGFGMSLTRFFNYLASKGDYIVVGRVMGSDALGLYERAYRLIEMPANLFAGVINKVAFPTMAEIQHEKNRLRRLYLNSIGLIGLVYIPLSVFLIFLGHEVITLLFGDQWEGAVASFQILCVGLLFRASYKISDSLIRAKAAVYQSAWRVSIYTLLVILGAYVGSRWGIEGVAVGILIALAGKFYLVAQLCNKMLNITWIKFAKTHIWGMIIGVVVFLCTHLTLSTITYYFSSPILMISGSSITNVLVLSLIVFFLNKSDYEDDLIVFIRKNVQTIKLKFRKLLSVYA